MSRIRIRVKTIIAAGLIGALSVDGGLLPRPPPRAPYLQGDPEEGHPPMTPPAPLTSVTRRSYATRTSA